jgi:thermitase
MKKRLISIALAMSGFAFAGDKEAKSLQGVDYVPGELIVKLKKNFKSNFLSQKSLAGFELQREMKLGFGDFLVVKTPGHKSLKSALSTLSNNPAVEYAEPNYIYHAIGFKNKRYSQIPNDPKFNLLWGLHNTGDNEPAGSRGNSSETGRAGADVNAMAAWELTKGSRNIKIAVIDTGVDYNHEDLKNNMWVNEAELNGQEGVDDDGNGFVDDIHGYDFANKDGDPLDGHGHGTHCAGTIAAEHDNGIGVAGVMSEASIVAVKFLSDSGSGTSEDALLAIDYATTIGVDIMSNSWGGGGASEALKEAIQRAHEEGIIFTAAAGNSSTNNDSSPHYPSNYDVPNVISVAAHNYNDGLASFSCYGPRTVHVAAPGRNILSTVTNNQYEVYSGTSMATPHVTGVVGLYLAYNGKVAPEELRNSLMSSSVYGSAYKRTTISMGRVDAYNFLTGVVAERPEQPDPNAWIPLYDYTFESKHPYDNNMNEEMEVVVENAKFLRVVIKKYELENRYDYLKILDSHGSLVDTVTGSGEDYHTEYVEGNTLKLKFTSDYSIGKWGYLIEEVQYIPNE